jgi:hypothetical protein
MQQYINSPAHYLKKTSFLQFSFLGAVKALLFGKKKKKGSDKPLFSWYPEPNFEFSGKEKDI